MNLHLTLNIFNKQLNQTKELESIINELDNIAVQCQTRKIEGGDDEEASVKSNTFIIYKETHKPIFLLLIFCKRLSQ